MTLTSKLQSSSQRRPRQRGIGRLDPTWDARPINWRGPGREAATAPGIESRSTHNIARERDIETGAARPPGHPETLQRVAQMEYGATPERPDCAGTAELANAPADRKTNTALQEQRIELRIERPQANRPGDRMARSHGVRAENHERTHQELGTLEGTGGSHATGTNDCSAEAPHWPTSAFDQYGNRTAAAAPLRGGRTRPIATRSVAQDRTLCQSRQKLIDDLRVMKRTRFNAQARFEAKHTASVSAFTLAAIVEIGLSLLGSNFGAGMSADVVSFIDYASQVTAVFILGFGLVVALAGHQTKALYLQRCAKDWGNLSREMQIAGPITRAELQDYRRRYHEIEGRCPPNHADVDLDKARLDKSDRKAVRDNKLDYLIDVYLSYAFSGLALSAFWIALWHFMVSS